MKCRTSSLVDTVAAARTRAALELAFCHFAKSLNAEFFAFIVAESTVLDGVSNFPRAFQERYVTGGYVKYDPVVAPAKRIRGPFSWFVDSLHWVVSREVV